MLLKKYEDLVIPIQQSWASNNYKDLDCKYNINKLVAKKKITTTFDNDIDNMFLYAIKYFDNLNNIVIIGKNKDESFQIFEDNYKNDFILFGIKEFIFDNKDIVKILYQLLFNRTNNSFDSTSKLYNYIKKYTYIQSILNNNIFNVNVSVLIVCNRNKNISINNFEENYNGHTIFIPINNNDKIIYSTLFFNNTSIETMKLQNLDKFLTKKFKNSFDMFIQYRSWIFDNIDIIYHDKFMLYSSILLSILGLRNANDLDIYIDNVDDKNLSCIKELINSKLFKFEYDISVKNTEYWPSHWNEWLDSWAKSIGLLYFEDILCNPKYHFYFLGVKVISLECDIARRIIRNRPKAIADLIALNKFCKLNINIPSIPSTEVSFKKTTDMSNTEIQELIKKGGIYNPKLSEIKFEKKINPKRFVGTIKAALKERFQLYISDFEIKKYIGLVEINKNTLDKNSKNFQQLTTIKPNNLQTDIKKKIKIKIKK